MKIRRLRHRTARRYLGPVDYDGWPCNVAMFNRDANKAWRRKLRDHRLPPRRFLPLQILFRPAVGVVYDKRTGRETRRPAWARRLDNPRSWPRDMRNELPEEERMRELKADTEWAIFNVPTIHNPWFPGSPPPENSPP